MKIAGWLPVVLMVFLALGITPLRAQEVVTLNGIITDSVTGKGLPFAQVSVRNSTTGTVSNDDGVFQLNIPGRLAQDTLLVAYLGYSTARYKIPASSVAALTFRLKPKAIELTEVEIKSLTPEEVIRQVVLHIPGNYGTDPVVLTAFIRSRKFLNNRLAEYTEAIIEDLKAGYTAYERRNEKERHEKSNVPLLLKGRVVSDTSLVNAIGDLGKSAGCLGCNFINDFVEFYHHTVLDEKLFSSYSFRMEELSKPEGGKLYHIWFDQRKGVKETLWKGELYVNAADFALLEISQRPSFEAFEPYEKQKYNHPYFIGGTPGWYEEMPLMDWTTTWSARSGSYYLSTIRINNWMTFKNPATGKTIRYDYRNDVIVTEVSRDAVKIENFRGDKSTGVNQRWDQVVGKEDQAFWRDFNYLPVEKKLKEDILKMKAKTN